MKYKNAFSSKNSGLVLVDININVRPCEIKTNTNKFHTVEVNNLPSTMAVDSLQRSSKESV